MDSSHHTGGHKSSNPITQLEDFLELYLVKKAPFQLPANVKEFIVKYGPWITLILVILSLPLLFAVLGLNMVFLNYMSYYGGLHSEWGLSLILGLVALGLEVIALPGLFRRSKQGWNFLFYADLILIVEYVVTGNFGGIISSVIGFYFLFQIREYYKS